MLRYRCEDGMTISVNSLNCGERRSRLEITSDERNGYRGSISFTSISLPVDTEEVDRLQEFLREDENVESFRRELYFFCRGLTYPRRILHPFF